MGELGAVEAAGGVDGWDGDVEVEDCDVDVHLPSSFFLFLALVVECISYERVG
jgi:hypothetical protein